MAPAGRSPAAPPPDAAVGTGLSGPVRLSTTPSGPAPPATSENTRTQLNELEVFARQVAGCQSDQGQVGGGEFDPRGARELRGARCGLQILEGTDLKSLVPDHEPVTVKIEDLDPIPPPITENVEAAIERILTEALTHQHGQTVVGFAQIGRRGGQEDRRRG